jgi:hypothetical protein
MTALTGRPGSGRPVFVGGGLVPATPAPVRALHLYINEVMSHIVTIKTQIRDTVALTAACLRLGLAPPEPGTAQLFTAQATGQILRLPGWNYPVVVDTAAGQVQFDNFNGAWGNPLELDKLLQAYAVEKAKLEARKAGHSVTEQSLDDGSIKLTLAVGGAA